jgi:NitT/TauT family transport system ATP-binding protein
MEPRRGKLMMSQEPVKFELRSVSKEFARERGAKVLTTVALDGLSFNVEAGRFVCLLGPSGCGKSTALQMMAGLEQPSSGEVLYQGTAVLGPDPRRPYVFQRFVLFPWLTAGENVAFGLRFKGIHGADARDIVVQRLEQVGLRGFEHHYPSELSGGMQQRVALARALAISPDVFLMDEPFGALDSQTRERMQEELIRLWLETDLKSRTIVFVTHDIRESVLLGDSIVLFTARPGRVKCELPVNLPRPRNPFDPQFVLLEKQVAELIKEEVRNAERLEREGSTHRSVDDE